MSTIADITVTTDYHLLSKQNVAKLLNCTTRTVDRLVASNRIPFLKIPTALGTRSRTMFDPRQITEWLNARTNNGEGQ